MAQRYGVCVIGGGPAGLAAAIAMAQTGRTVALIERAQPPIDKACGEGLLPGAVAALHRLGVVIPAGSGFRFCGIRFSDQNSSAASLFHAGCGIAVRRTVLHRLLAERAAQLNVRLVWGAADAHVDGQSVHTPGGTFQSDCIIAADGQNSKMRKRAGLDQVFYERRRFGFRRHFALEPWSHYIEVYWHERCQLYVTPVNAGETSVAVLTADPHLRVQEAISLFPDVTARLAGVRPLSREMGSLSVLRRLRSITRPGLTLCGDASGGVDAITGEGLGLAFRQALALAEDGVAAYPANHRAISRRPHTMAALLLLLSDYPSLRRRVLAGFAAHPRTFEALLGLHAGESRLTQLLSWDLLETCCAILAA